MPEIKYFVNINANDLKVLNVATPTDDKDAANKKYVDDTVGGLTIPKNESFLIGNGVDTTFPITHTLNTMDFVWSARITATGDTAIANVKPLTNTTASVSVHPSIILDTDELTLTLVG